LAAAEWCSHKKTEEWYRRVGVALCAFNHYDKSFEYFLRSDEISPNQWLTKAGMSMVHFQKEEWRKAIDLDEKTEQVLQKMIQDGPENATTKDLSNSLHIVQERIGDAYGQLNDKNNRSATFKRAILTKPSCDRCINVVIFHNNGDCMYQDTIDLLKLLES
jgi:tetratricopeptide (TPR) repeat protein